MAILVSAVSSYALKMEGTPEEIKELTQSNVELICEPNELGGGSYSGNNVTNISTTTSATQNKMILDDVVHAVQEGRSPLLLTERTGHLEQLAELLEGKIGM